MGFIENICYIQEKVQVSRLNCQHLKITFKIRVGNANNPLGKECLKTVEKRRQENSRKPFKNSRKKSLELFEGTF